MSLPVNAQGDERVKNVTLWYNTAKITAVYIETAKGLSVSKGPQLAQFTRREILIPDDEALIGFEGTAGSQALYSLSPLTVKLDCWPQHAQREEDETLFKDERFPDTGNKVNVGAVVAIVVVVWFIVFVVPFTMVMIKWYRSHKKKGLKIIPDTERAETNGGEDHNDEGRTGGEDIVSS